jgi:AI-2 transport system ATP-binding protein
MPEVNQATDPSANAGVAPPLVSLKGVWKVFESVPVLRGISFDLKAGEIHALLGGNGSGKSTTVKILCGAHKPTAGVIELNGQPQTFDRPSDAHAKGIYMVPQEPHIFANQTVRENLLIGLAGDVRAYSERCERLARELGLTCDFSTCAGELSIASQQLIEIIRGLLRNARVLIFDEPTSALTIREVKSLFGQMKKLSADGIGIFFISHRLNEVLEISDRVSVLRDGVFVLTAATATLTTNDLVAAMRPAGSAPTNAPEQAQSSAARSPTPTLEVRNLSGKMFHEVSFNVFPGEVVGLAGLVGAGRTELAEAILGIDQHVSGDVAIDGRAAPARSPRICQRLGLAYVPEDRHAHGIFLELPGAQTISASILARLGRPFLSAKREAAVVAQFVQRLGIKLSSPTQLARTLSGGNQQKAVLAKALAALPRIIILDEPTRGIDAQARQDVYRLIRDLTAQGVGVLVISSELAEIIDLSDRILVMYRGRVAEVPRSQARIDQVSAAVFGMAGGAAA